MSKQERQTALILSESRSPGFRYIGAHCKLRMVSNRRVCAYAGKEENKGILTARQGTPGIGFKKKTIVGGIMELAGLGLNFSETGCQH